MKSNTEYNKIKIIYKLSKISHFINKHGIPEAQAIGDSKVIDIYSKASTEIDRIVEELNSVLCKK